MIYIANFDTLNNQFYEFMWNYRRVLTCAPPLSPSNIKVGILDSGVNINHPYLYNKVINKANLTSSDFKDNVGHGTQISGVINILCDNITIYSYKLYNDFREINNLNIIRGIYISANDGIDILNISLGTYQDYSTSKGSLIIESYKKAVQYAKEKGMLIVASAGNDNLNTNDISKIHLPSDLNSVICVGSSTRYNRVAPYSNFGKNVDIYAPTGNLYNESGSEDTSQLIITYNSGHISPLQTYNKISNIPGYLTLSYGTSLAVPQVLVALYFLMTKFPNKEIDFYKNKILENSYNLFEENYELRIL